MSLVSATGSVRLEQCPEWRHDRLGLRSIGDVFAGEGVLVHRRPHVSWIELVDPQARLLNGQCAVDLVESSLG
jgi:hypothetical protein